MGRFKIQDPKPRIAERAAAALGARGACARTKPRIPGLGHEHPQEDAAAASWLPAPAVDFRPVMRMYGPDAAVLERSYAVPGITRSAD